MTCSSPACRPSVSTGSCSTSNSVYDGAGFGADLTVHAGFYRRGWFLAGLVGYDRTFVTHIEHTDWYRDNVYAEAVEALARRDTIVEALTNHAVAVVASTVLAERKGNCAAASARRKTSSPKLNS